jgi:hypothetical protein
VTTSLPSPFCREPQFPDVEPSDPFSLPFRNTHSEHTQQKSPSTAKSLYDPLLDSSPSRLSASYTSLLSSPDNRLALSPKSRLLSSSVSENKSKTPVNILLPKSSPLSPPHTGDKGLFTQWVHVDYIVLTGIK